MSVRRRPLGFAALIASAAVAILAACTVMNGLHLPEPDGGVAVIDASEAAPPPDPCVHTSPPGPPSHDDNPSGDVGDLVFALRSYDFNEVAGFDLDGVCSCDTRPNTAFDGGPSCTRPAPAVCDGDGGIDNQLAVLATEFSAFISAQPFNKLINGGRRTALIQVSNYNGLANDSDVAVALFDAAGIFDQGCPNSVLDPMRNLWSPGWCGFDAWSIDSRSVEVSGTQVLPHVVARGYVANHRLVVRVDSDVPLPGSSSNKKLSISAALLTATLEPSSLDGGARDPDAGVGTGSFKIVDGVLAGRVNTKALLGWAGTQGLAGPNSTPDQAVCLSGIFSTLKSTICQSSDLNAKGNVDLTATCTALSAAISFTAFPAKRAEVRPEPTNNGPCDPGDDGNPLDASVTYVCP